jgi:hypothetical protein
LDKTYQIIRKKAGEILKKKKKKTPQFQKKCVQKKIKGNNYPFTFEKNFPPYTKATL